MTIYALSSGTGIAGISVIRVSGPETKNVIKNMIFKLQLVEREHGN